MADARKDESITVSLPDDLCFTQGGFLFDSSTGFTYTLNHTGAFIFNRLKEGRGKGEILQDLIETFDVDKDRARDDFEDFLIQLRELDPT
jgi:PqqD family protein of HPr-rel-A system